MKVDQGAILVSERVTNPNFVGYIKFSWKLAALKREV